MREADEVVHSCDHAPHPYFAPSRYRHLGCRRCAYNYDQNEVHREDPEIMTGSVLAQPKVMYRAGTKYCRVEEAEDSQNKIHGLFIVDEPDAWMINLYDKLARHVVDPGPTFNCKLPIFAPVDSKDEGAIL
jgi:hypothetical protein